MCTLSSVNQLYIFRGDFVQIIEYGYSINATKRSDGTVTIYTPNLPEINEYGYYQQILSEQITRALTSLNPVEDSIICIRD
ncbi:MAG: hypothetical protein QXI87_00185 [Thermoproteota archaeon]